MSPRTPASIVVGTLVTLSLFGLMRTMVREPGEIPSPTPRVIDPFVSVADLASSPPPIQRQVPRKPEPSPRPGTEPVVSTFNLQPAQGPGRTVELPPFAPTLPTSVIGPISEHRGVPPSDPGACSDGEARPRLLVTPEYPRAARSAGLEGEVEVAFTVAQDGSVLDARVVRASPRGAFESATLRAVRLWRFEAASAECPRAAEARRETVSFRLDGVED